MLTYTQIKDLDKGARLPIIRGGWGSLKFIVGLCVGCRDVGTADALLPFQAACGGSDWGSLKMGGGLNRRCGCVAKMLSCCQCFMRGWQLGKIFGLSYVLNIVENKKNSSFLWEHCIKNQAAWLRYESFAVPFVHWSPAMICPITDWLMMIRKMCWGYAIGICQLY